MKLTQVDNFLLRVEKWLALFLCRLGNVKDCGGSNINLFISPKVKKREQNRDVFSVKYNIITYYQFFIQMKMSPYFKN